MWEITLTTDVWGTEWDGILTEQLTETCWSAAKKFPEELDETDSSSQRHSDDDEQTDFYWYIKNGLLDFI